jgi:hypothetical protein
MRQPIDASPYLFSPRLFVRESGRTPRPANRRLAAPAALIEARQEMFDRRRLGRHRGHSLDGRADGKPTQRALRSAVPKGGLRSRRERGDDRAAGEVLVA